MNETFIDILKIIATPISTIVVAIFVYKYTNNYHRKTLLNELDSKSEWRKTLFIIAGKNKLQLADIQQIRASVRAFKKITAKSKFDIISNDIIDFCDKTYLVYYCYGDSNLPYKINEQAKIYCRYLLADHWEKLQLSTWQMKEYNKIKEESPLEYRTIFNFHYFKVIEKEEDLYKQTIQKIKELN